MASVTASYYISSNSWYQNAIGTIL